MENEYKMPLWMSIVQTALLVTHLIDWNPKLWFLMFYYVPMCIFMWSWLLKRILDNHRTNYAVIGFIKNEDGETELEMLDQGQRYDFQEKDD